MVVEDFGGDILEGFGGGAGLKFGLDKLGGRRTLLLFLSRKRGDRRCIVRGTTCRGSTL